MEIGLRELQHCNKCNKTFARFFIHNEEKDMKIFGGYEIITYICSIKQIKQLDYARDTKNVWNEILLLFT